MRILAVAATMLLVTPVAAADQPAKEKKVCKSVEPPTGSRMGIRTICRTAAEWESNRLAVQRDMEFRSRSDANLSETNGPGEPR